MGRTSISIQERARTYKKHQFYVSGSNILMCKLCSQRLEWKKKDALDKHIKSNGHIKAKNKFESKSSEEQQCVKRQSTFGELDERQKRAKLERVTFIEDTVRMCLKTNIPLHKLDDPAFREYAKKYIAGSGDLPCADTLRREYLPECGKTHKEEIKVALANKPIVVIADETSDSMGRCVFAVLFQTITATDKQEVYLTSCSFLESANGTTCSQAIFDTIKEFNIEYSNVLGLVSDSARYMGTCFKAMETIIGDHILHFQCFAHKVNLVGDVIVKEMSELNTLVSKVKMAFLHSRKLKSLYLKFLNENYADLSAVLFPAPVLTRWNSWFHSVEYLDKYMPALLKFLEGLDEDGVLNSSCISILDMFRIPEKATLLTIQLKFVSQISTKICSLITKLEGYKYPLAHVLWDELQSLSSHLKRLADGWFPAESTELLSNVDNLREREEIKLRLKLCMQKCHTKLSTHMEFNKTNTFFQEVGNLFNPATAGQKSKFEHKQVIASKAKIPFFTEMSTDLFIEGYEYFHNQLATQVREGKNVDILQMLLAIKIKYPIFSTSALKSIWAPTNSVNAERFFSQYNLIVTDRRNRMKESTIQTCALLKFSS